MEKLSLSAVKVDGLYYLTKNGYQSAKDLLAFRADPEWKATFHSQWVSSPGLPNAVEKFVTGKKENERYELKPEYPADCPMARNLPMVDERGNKYWSDDFQWRDILGAYDFKFEVVPDYYEPVEFECVVLGEFSGFHPPQHEFSYPLPKTYDGPQIHLTAKDVSHQLLDSMVFPEFVLADRPCRLTEEQSFRIVREFLRTNIDPRYAKLASDYEFTVRVEKVIPLARPYPTKRNVSHSRRPRYTEIMITDRKAEIYHLDSKQGKDKKTLMFAGDSQDDLTDKIDAYLADLKQTINAPLAECKHCDGKGYTV